MIPPVRVIREGVENEEVVRIFTRNSRFPDMLKGDLKAIMAACRLGAARLEEVIARHGIGRRVAESKRATPHATAPQPVASPQRPSNAVPGASN